MNELFSWLTDENKSDFVRYVFFLFFIIILPIAPICAYGHIDHYGYTEPSNVFLFIEVCSFFIALPILDTNESKGKKITLARIYFWLFIIVSISRTIYAGLRLFLHDDWSIELIKAMYFPPIYLLGITTLFFIIELIVHTIVKKTESKK